MKHNAFNYELTIAEMAYLVFKKKICPNCKGKMDKIKTYETVSGEEMNALNTSTTDDFIYNPSAKVKKYIYKFKCKHCEKEYLLSDLVKKK